MEILPHEEGVRQEEMRDDNWRWQLALILLLLIIMCFFFNAILHPYTEAVYISEGNIFKGFFTEPFETLVLIFKDGSFLKFSTHDEYMIRVSPDYVNEVIEKKGKKVGDCVLMVHNHLNFSQFTEGNNTFYRWMKAKGFRGSFCIYYSLGGRVLLREDK